MPRAEVPEPDPTTGIYVLAGVNGAGKSSILGETFLRNGVAVFDPDAATDEILLANPGVSRDQANGLAWQQGKVLLEAAIEQRHSFAFETTLGGHTIQALLDRALREGHGVYVLYLGLESPEMHIARVRSRVTLGGHDIPEHRIRQRFDSSRLNLIRLLPRLTELRVYDNSKNADPASGIAPAPVLVLHTARGRVVTVMAVETVPDWAKPIVAAALGTAGT